MNPAPPGPETVPGLLESRAAASPNATAFWRETGGNEHPWDPIDWESFAGRVAVLRRALVAAGLRKGERLALIAPVSLEWELLHHAALSMGAVVVGLDAHDLPERIADMARQAGVSAYAAASPAPLARLTPDQWRSTRFVLPLTGSTDGCPDDWPADWPCLRWQAFESAGVPASESGQAPMAQDTATIIFTSGTTGAPKGIAYTHAQLCLAIEAISDAFDFVGPGSRLLCWLPMSNLFQRVVNLAGMRRGAASYLLGDPRRVMDVVGGVAPDVFIGVPRFYEKLLDGIRQRVQGLPVWSRRIANWAWQVGRLSSPGRQQAQALPLPIRFAWSLADRLVLARIRAPMGSRLKCMITGSAPTPRYILEEFHALGWRVLEAYGLSENVLPMAMNRLDDFRFGSVGKPLPGNSITVDPGGELYVTGAGVFSGYLGQSASSTGRSGGYRTGDLGRFDADGYLHLHGRHGELIKTSTGRRIAPAAAESRLQQVPGIDQAVVIGNGRKHLVAVCSFAGPAADDEARRILVARLTQVIGTLEPSTRPLAAALIWRPFSIDRGELTANLKIRRRAIESLHAATIDHLYALVASGMPPPNTDLVVFGTPDQTDDEQDPRR